MSNFKLYEINRMLEEAIVEVNKMAEENEGEVPDDWSKFLDDIQMERDKKLLDVSRYIKTLNAKSEAIKNEEKNLKAKRASLENASERLISYVEKYINKGEKIEDSNTTLSWRKSERVIVDSESNVPDKFCVVERKAQLAAIKTAIKTGEEVPGAHVEQFLNLQIK